MKNKLISVMFGLIILVSCTEKPKKIEVKTVKEKPLWEIENENFKENVNPLRVNPDIKFNDLDSLIVHYVDMDIAIGYFYVYRNNKLKKSKTFHIDKRYSLKREFYKEVKSKEITNHFIENIKAFCFENEPTMIRPRIGKDGIVHVTDYDFLTSTGFIAGKKVFEQKHTMYEEKKYNPKFYKFYEFLDSLVVEK